MYTNTLNRALRGRRRPQRAFAGAVLLAALAALAVAGCGSSKSSSSSTTTSSAHAVKVTPTKVAAVASPKGARSLKSVGLKGLGHVPRGGGFGAHIQGFSGIPLTQAIPAISGDINQFWSGLAAKNNIQWPQVQETLVTTQPVQTPCTSKPTISPNDPLYICAAPPTSGQPTTMFWPVPFIQQNIDTDQGRVNLTFTMASIWSYQVQNVIGSDAALQQGSMSKADWAQQNVCLTGVYVNSINNRKLFETGDSNAIQNILNNLSGTFGITSPDVAPQQLQSAFVAGFNSGDPGGCSGGGGTSTTPSTTTTGP